jgi:hypothetical protein
MAATLATQGMRACVLALVLCNSDGSADGTKADVQECQEYVHAFFRDLRGRQCRHAPPWFSKLDVQTIASECTDESADAVTVVYAKLKYIGEHLFAVSGPCRVE